jgi:enoyl-CoA hydratase
MTYTNLTIDVSERIATLTVSRPDKLNALDGQTMDELERAIGELEARTDVGGIIVTGAGRAFVAGADISELATQSPAEALERARKGQRIFSRFEESAKPVLAAVNGFALGGGCELAMACHMRIASEAARFGQPEVKLGLLPGYGGTQRLPRLVGTGRALALLLSGDMIDAQEALRIGLVDRVVPGESLLAEARALMGRILQNAPLALGQCIAAVLRGRDLPLREALEVEARAFGWLAGTEDAAEGTRAFLEKRAARFRGK